MDRDWIGIRIGIGIDCKETHYSSRVRLVPRACDTGDTGSQAGDDDAGDDADVDDDADVEDDADVDDDAGVNGECTTLRGIRRHRRASPPAVQRCSVFAAATMAGLDKRFSTAMA